MQLMFVVLLAAVWLSGTVGSALIQYNADVTAVCKI